MENDLKVDAAGRTAVENPRSRYIPFWDWQLVLEYANNAEEDAAEKVCRRLVEMSTERVDKRQQEEAYRRLASIKIARGEYEQAIEVCKPGLDSLKQSSTLNRLIAYSWLKLNRPQEAMASINLIESDSEFRRRQLEGAGGVGMSSTEKAEIRQQIAVDVWTVSLLTGEVALIQNDFSNSIRFLKNAFETSLAISVDSRVEAGLLLALCYARSNQWDLAGQTYDAVSQLRPSDRDISLKAVQAWRLAGSTERANQQVNNIDDGSFSAALERALLISASYSSEAEKRNVMSALKVARERLNAVPEEERTKLEQWRLELLELRFVSSEKSPQEKEQDSLDRLESIAQRYAGVAEVQMQAAIYLATLGRLEASMLALERLDIIAGNSNAADDRVNAVMARANVALIKKDYDGARKLLEDAIVAMPDQVLRLAKSAAEIEIRANRLEGAYELMSRIPEDKLDFPTLVLLTGIADSLRVIAPAKYEEISVKLDKWIDRLKKTEGEGSTNWRYLAAEKLIAKIANEGVSKELLDQAYAYYKQIDIVRPRWGLASALGGRIASIRAELESQRSASEEAIALWKRAIRDGDNRISTVLSLVRELNLVGRGDEAEVELRRISNFADSVVPVSAMAVSFAVGRGDFSEALARAEQLTVRKPEEVDGWLLRAQTAITAANSALGLDEASRIKLRADSWTFLEKAHILSAGKNMAVWDARFRLKLFTAGKDEALVILDDLLKEKAFSEEVRFLEAGRRYLALREFGRARQCLDNCLIINPRSADAYLGLADLHAAIGDSEDSLNALRMAQKLAPKNYAIRDRLALKIAFGREGEADWTEIDALLTNSALPSTPKSQTIAAWIALKRGDSDRQARAVKSLRDISQSSSAERHDAKRLLAHYFAIQWSSKADTAPAESTNSFETARGLYEELMDDAASIPDDAARYVSLILNYYVKAKEKKIEMPVDYLTLAERALQKLESATGSSIASLQLRIQLEQARGEDATVGSIAQSWVDGASDLQSLGIQNLWEITGQTLMQLGHTKESLAWLEKLYDKDPKKYGLLVIALTKDRQFERALDICMKAYQSEPSPIAATLIIEVAMVQTDLIMKPEAAQVIKDALVKFPDSAELMEAMGTIELLKRRLPEAVSFYETAEKLAPKRRRTLNNLAMALSEMPMRKTEALVRIEKAIAIYGRDPDLLDTLGQVQFRNGKLDEGLKTLLEASDRRDDVSFRIHIAQVLIAKNDISGAKDQWLKIKQNKLDDLVLTSEDSEVLAQLNSRFEGKL